MSKVMSGMGSSSEESEALFNGVMAVMREELEQLQHADAGTRAELSEAELERITGGVLSSLDESRAVAVLPASAVPPAHDSPPARRPRIKWLSLAALLGGALLGGLVLDRRLREPAEPFGKEPLAVPAGSEQTAPVLKSEALQSLSDATWVFHPAAWILGGSNPERYELGPVEHELIDGRQQLDSSRWLRSRGAVVPEQFGTMMTSIQATPFRGQRVRMKGYVKSKDVPTSAGLWFRVDADAAGMGSALDNMSDRPIRGTTEWRAYELVLDVPEDARTLNFGVLLRGTGQVWVKGVTLDIVPSKPTGSLGGSGWTLMGSPGAYEIGEVMEFGQLSSRYVRSVPNTAGNFGALNFTTPATSARGQRLRLTGLVKAKEVKEWAGLWLRVDDTNGAVLAFDNMAGRPIRGTKDWKPYEVVLDVPAAATSLSFGVLVTGSGEVALKDVKLQVVPTSVPTTVPPK
jgi:hypothetical protein